MNRIKFHLSKVNGGLVKIQTDEVHHTLAARRLSIAAFGGYHPL
jgi:hypothetical protein